MKCSFWLNVIAILNLPAAIVLFFVFNSGLVAFLYLLGGLVSFLFWRTLAVLAKAAEQYLGVGQTEDEPDEPA